MTAVNKHLNEKNLQVFEDEVSNYLTDSDIEDDDPKYTPILTRHTQEKNYNAQDNLLPTHMRINSLQLDSHIIPSDKDNEINMLKTEIFKLQESTLAKDVIIKEFENLVSITKERFKQFEEANQQLKGENEELQSQLIALDKAVADYKSKVEANESTQKSLKLYEEHLGELEAEFTAKEAKITKRFQEREEAIRKEYLSEIAKVSKEAEDLKIDNEKQRYDLSLSKVKSAELQQQLEDKDLDYTLDFNQKAKEITKLTEQVKQLAGQLSQLELNSNQKRLNNEKDLLSAKDDSNSLLIESNAKKEQIASLETCIENYKHEIEMMANEQKEMKSQCENKDVIIDQMRNQNDLLYKEIAARENEMIGYDQLRQSEAIELNNQMTTVIREKNELESENAELVEHFGQANEQLRKMNDLIADKFAPMEMTLYKQAMKNENMEKKYKAMIKEMKYKEKSLLQENESFKERLQEKIEGQSQANLRNASFYYQNNAGLNENNTSRPHDRSISIANYNYTSSGNKINLNHSKIEDFHADDSQKKTLDEFKRLLAKIDDKLDLPTKNTH